MGAAGAVGRNNVRESRRGVISASHRGDVIVVLVVLDKDRLPQQITHLDSQRPRQLSDDVQAPHIPYTPLNLADPVLGAANQIPEHALAHSASPSIESDAFADSHLITSTAHASILPAAAMQPQDFDKSTWPNYKRFGRRNALRGQRPRIKDRGKGRSGPCPVTPVPEGSTEPAPTSTRTNVC
jgi:hypothetical protein